MKSMKLWYILPLIALTVVSCSRNDNASLQEGRPIPRVEVVQPEIQSLQNTLISSGTITSRSEVRVTAQTEGKITVLNVEEGDRIRQGEVIIRLDDSIPHAQYKEAEATHRDAQRNLERAQQLYERNLISEQEYQNIVTQVQVAQSRYEYRRALFEYTTIRAPINGVITYRGVDQGDIASPRDHLLTVTNLDNLVIRVNVSELEVPYISQDEEVTVQVDAYGDSRFRGSVRRIFPAADPATRLIPVEVELIDKDDRLFPGLFARVEFVTERRENVLVIPIGAVQTSPQGERYIYTVNDDTAHYRKVTLGIRSDRYVEIVDGITSDEQVVIRGVASLRDGTPVQLISER
jgi:RND family efflux transporter MFP subunit